MASVAGRKPGWSPPGGRIGRRSLIAACAALVLAAGAGYWRWSAEAAAPGGRFSLVDQTGTPFTEGDMAGRPTLVFFGFAHSPDVGPTVLFQLSEVLTRLGADAQRFNVLFVTVDPERDTAAAMARYLAAFHPRLRGLTGSRVQVEGMLRAYGVSARRIDLPDGNYTFEMARDVFVMDGEGEFSHTLDLTQGPDAAADDLRGLLGVS